MLHRSYPLLFRILAWIVLPVSLSLGALHVYLSKSLPRQAGQQQVAGLTAKVEVVRDAHAVPHIRAATDADAFFTLGYLHAQERLWQMEYQRRLGQGRLSEIFGSSKLATDQYMRTLGLHRAAKLAVQSLEDAARKTLAVYVAGVNAWLEEGHVLPPEYHILGFSPEPWQPEDSLLQMKLMALDLDFNFRQELLFDVLVKHMGAARAGELLPGYSSAQTAASAERPAIDGKMAAGLIARGNLVGQRFDIGGERLGSNAWVVSGQLTQSGSPMLANDTHLATVIPAVWYLAHMQGDRLNVSGATYPGMPFVILGRNDSIAWGGTALGGDVQDLYMERINPLAEDQYEVDGQWVQMEVDEEWIRVKSEFPSFLTEPIPPLKWQVRRTRHGPLISDSMERVANPLALRWTALDAQDRTYQSFLRINYAQNWTEFKRALEDHVAPTLNFVYADVQGNIAYIAGGKIPMRQAGDGRLPVAGWQSTHEWGDYIPIDALPQGFNPDKGYIVSANNINHAPDYPHLISNSWAPAYRADRIGEALESRISGGQPLQVKDFTAIQGDVQSLQARELLSFLRALQPETPQQQRAIEQLAQWDGSVLENSVPAALYQAWFRHFSRLVVNDELIGDLLRPERFDALQLFAEQLNPVFIQQVVAQDFSKAGAAGGHDWCDRIDTKEAERCEGMALSALDRAIDELATVTGGYQRWGEIHEVYYEHRGFADIELLDYFFDRQVPGGGDGYSVNVGGWRYSKDKGYQQSSGASYRQVIDLSDWRAGGFLNNTGQSGNVFSEHYDDNIGLHKRLELLPMHIDAQRESGRGLLLTLEPSGAGGKEAASQ